MFLFIFLLFLIDEEWSPLRQEPEAPQNNATSRGLHRIPPPAEAGGFQTAGLIACPIILNILAEGTLTFLSGKGKNSLVS